MPAAAASSGMTGAARNETIEIAVRTMLYAAIVSLVIVREIQRVINMLVGTLIKEVMTGRITVRISSAAQASVVFRFCLLSRK